MKHICRTCKYADWFDRTPTGRPAKGSVGLCESPWTPPPPPDKPICVKIHWDRWTLFERWDDECPAWEGK